jgi:hypothetical protein
MTMIDLSLAVRSTPERLVYPLILRRHQHSGPTKSRHRAGHTDPIGL